MLAYFPGIMMPQFLVLASICCVCRWASLFKAKYNKLRDRYDTIIIKSTLLIMRKPLHYLIWWGNMDLRWSWWRVEDKYQFEFPLLCNALLLNLAFRIWIYSRVFLKFGSIMLIKNPICLCSFLLKLNRWKNRSAIDGIGVRFLSKSCSVVL